VIAKGLDNPCGVAVQPETGHVFVSAHPAVYRLVPAKEAYSCHVEIDGFATDAYGRGPEYEIGPLGLAFVGRETLVVGGGDLQDGEDLVRFYKVESKPRPERHPIKADATCATSGPFVAGDDSLRGEGNFFGVAVKGSTLFVTSNGDDTRGWISKIVMMDGKPGPITPFIASKQETGVDAPTGATISPEGKLVVCQFGEANIPGDGLVTVYDPDSGALETKYKTGLNDPAGIAYSPKTGKLYVVDFSWIDPEKGGLFSLEPSAKGLKAIRVAKLTHPSALAFAPGGRLFVTVVGLRNGDDSDDPKKPLPGLVVTFEGL
jgi:DNA-binding beta-propeller fold protein YncE